MTAILNFNTTAEWGDYLAPRCALFLESTTQEYDAMDEFSAICGLVEEEEKDENGMLREFTSILIRLFVPMIVGFAFGHLKIMSLDAQDVSFHF